MIQQTSVSFSSFLLLYLMPRSSWYVTCWSGKATLLGMIPSTEVRTDGHSLQIVNRCNVSVALGLRERVVSLTEKPKQLGLILPGESLWLPVMRPEPGIFCLKPHGGCLCSNCYFRNEG